MFSVQIQQQPASQCIIPHCGLVVPIFVESRPVIYSIEHSDQQHIWNEVQRFAHNYVVTRPTFHDGVLLHKTFDIQRIPLNVYYIIFRKAIRVDKNFLKKCLLAAIYKHWEKTHYLDECRVVIPFLHRIGLSRRFVNYDFTLDDDIFVVFCTRFRRSSDS